ncbi:hypothetical protein FB451DRAFT_1359069 [Mycena latifolia]|nr:hypothetical protein FB451DRAFT_1359069 [Mycena latifolia]
MGSAYVRKTVKYRQMTLIVQIRREHHPRCVVSALTNRDHFSALSSWHPTDPAASAPPNTCELGSISRISCVPFLFLSPSFIDVQAPEDVIAAYDFSKTTGVPLVVKNMGHDFMGPSSGRGAMALWVRVVCLRAAGFTEWNTRVDPQSQGHLVRPRLRRGKLHKRIPGCHSRCTPLSQSYFVWLRALTTPMQAGVKFFEAFELAEAKNITLVGGSDGGGHGVLAPALGLGVDRALQLKIVTPDGVYRTASACEKEDLFFALRGGGGGTFGVAVVITWAAKHAARTKALWALITDNMLAWADAGCGGYAMPELALFVTQCLDKDAAAASMAPLIVHAEQMKAESVEGAMVMVMQSPSFLPFFTSFMTEAGGNAGAGREDEFRHTGVANPD